MQSYKIYIDGLLWEAYSMQASFKAEVIRLENLLDLICNAPQSALQTNVKHK